MKRSVVCLLLWLMGSLPIYAIGVAIGVQTEGGITRGYGSLGLYRFVGTIQGTPVRTVRSSHQVVQFYGGAGPFVQLDLHHYYSLLVEVTYLFNRGMSFSGNYDDKVIQEQVGYRPLVGQLSYSWQAMNFNFINKVNIIKIDDLFSIYLMAGPSLSVNVSEKIIEEFEPEYALASPPYHKKQRRALDVRNRVDIGITAGVGSEVNLLGHGRLSFSIRTSWYFIPQLATYLSHQTKVKVSSLISLHLGYAFNLS